MLQGFAPLNWGNKLMFKNLVSVSLQTQHKEFKWLHIRKWSVTEYFWSDHHISTWNKYHQHERRGLLLNPKKRRYDDILPGLKHFKRADQKTSGQEYWKIQIWMKNMQICSALQLAVLSHSRAPFQQFHLTLGEHYL
jgi:hypothetical protein